MNNNFPELPVQLQQHQITTDQMNEDSYSTVNDCLSPDYAMPTINTQTSPQVHIYASLDNAEVERHGYSDFTRSKESTTKLTNTSEQCPQVHSIVITRDNNRGTAYQIHYYARLKNPEAISHEYAVLTTSTNVTNELISNSKQRTQDVTLMPVSNKEVSVSPPSHMYPQVHTYCSTEQEQDGGEQLTMRKKGSSSLPE